MNDYLASRQNGLSNRQDKVEAFRSISGPNDKSLLRLPYCVPFLLPKPIWVQSPISPEKPTTVTAPVSAAGLPIMEDEHHMKELRASTQGSMNITQWSKPSQAICSHTR